MVYHDFNILADSIANCSQKVLATEVLKFNANLIQDWPVDTGLSRRAWLLSKVSKDEYRLSNDVNYSPIIWKAKRSNVAKPDNIIWWHGAGGEPRLQKTIDNIEKKVARC